jgi:HD-like signal output (HDOD) protein
LRQPVTSIQQALSLLGVQSVINIVNAASLRNTLSNEAISALTLFWDNAMDIAAASALIARKLGICSPDEAYALGLFHNCGIPLLLEKFSDYLLTIMEAYSVIDGRITDIEDAQINTNHAVIGYFVARSWKLPMPICEVILDHHRTEEVFGYKEMEQTEKKNMLAVLKLAAHLCGTHKVLGKVELDYEFSRLSDILMSYLGLSSIDLVDLKDDLVELGL